MLHGLVVHPSDVRSLVGLLHVRVVTCSKLRDDVVLATELTK